MWAQPACFSRLRTGRSRRPLKRKEHHAALDILSREIRRYTAAMFRPDTSPREADLLASLIEEEDFTASLGETLFQVARRVERQPFSPTWQRVSRCDAGSRSIERCVRSPRRVLARPQASTRRSASSFCCLRVSVAWSRAPICPGKSAVGFWSSLAVPSEPFC